MAEWYDKLEDAVEVQSASPVDIQEAFANLDLEVGDVDISPDSYTSFLSGVLRSLGQGVTFGSADEMEAAVRAALGEGGYTELRDQIRANLDQFRDENTALAFGLEIGASMLTPVGAVAGATRLAPAAGRAMGQTLRTQPIRTTAAGGALYGAGTAEEISDIPLQAALGGAIGLGAGAVTPIISRRAEALRKAGLPITIGQIYPGMKRGEEALTSVPIMGGQIVKATEASIEAFPALVYNRALRPLGVKIDPKASPRAAFQQAEKAFRKSYDSALKGVEVTVDQPFVGALARVSADAAEALGETGATQLKDFNAIIKSQVMGRVKDGKMNADDLKAVQSFLGKKSTTLRKRGNPSDIEYADALDDLDITLMDAFTRASPEKATLLRKANRAYSRYVPLRRAAAASGEAAFTPAKLVQTIRAEEAKRGAAGLGRLAAGRGTMQPIAEIGQDVLGRQLADSGTAGRMEMSRLLRTGLSGVGLGAGGLGVGTGAVGLGELAAIAGAGLLGAGAYTPLGQAGMRLAIPGVSTALRTPAAPGLISEQMMSP